MHECVHAWCRQRRKLEWDGQTYCAIFPPGKTRMGAYGRTQPIRRSAAVCDSTSRSNARTFSRVGSLHTPVANHVAAAGFHHSRAPAATAPCLFRGLKAWHFIAQAEASPRAQAWVTRRDISPALKGRHPPNDMAWAAMPPREHGTRKNVAKPNQHEFNTSAMSGRQCGRRTAAATPRGRPPEQ